MEIVITQPAQRQGKRTDGALVLVVVDIPGITEPRKEATWTGDS